jgi:hypothetical protein
VAREYCNVSNTGAEFEDTLAWANASLTEESVGERGQKRGLPNQALVFRVGAAQSVMRGWTTR